METNLELFSFDSWKSLIGSCEEDIFYSPYSAYCCMMMAGLLSTGETRRQILEALGRIDFNIPNEDIAHQLMSIYDYVEISKSYQPIEPKSYEKLVDMINKLDKNVMSKINQDNIGAFYGLIYKLIKKSQLSGSVEECISIIVQKAYDEFLRKKRNPKISYEALIREMISKIYVISEATICGSNDIWPNESLSLPMEKIDILQRVLMTNLTPVKFPQPGCDIINSHIKEATKGLISSIVDPSDLFPSTKIVLTNAIYFKASWTNLFKANQTRKLKWNGPKQYDIDMMHQTSKIMYTENPIFQAVSLDYNSIPFSMLILLPKSNEIGQLKPLSESLNSEFMKRVVLDMKPTTVKLAIPKFEASWGASNLNSMFQSLGIVDIYSDKSEFLNNIDISDVLQKTFVSVDEEGTEAAAVTAMISRSMVMIPKDEIIFKADHPFLYMIRDNRTGIILFMGLCINPKIKQK